MGFYERFIKVNKGNIMSREEELSKIDEFLKIRGVTRVPSANDPEFVMLNEKAPLVFDFKKRVSTRRTINVQKRFSPASPRPMRKKKN